MLELEHRFRVLDLNVQLDPDAEEAAARGREMSPERLQREMHQAGVVRAVVTPGPRPEGVGYLSAPSRGSASTGHCWRSPDSMGP